MLKYLFALESSSNQKILGVETLFLVSLLYYYNFDENLFKKGKPLG